MNQILLFVLLICGLPMLGGCTSSNTYTLYRNSVLDADMRIHIATFDSKEKSYGGTSESYNKYNCDLAARLFQAEPNNISNNYWCEKGRYKP